MVARQGAFTLFPDGCVTLDIAVSSTLTWRTPRQIPSTVELDIELSQKLSAIALSDVQAERASHLSRLVMHRRQAGGYPSCDG
jgi:hypothetical protein